MPPLPSKATGASATNPPTDPSHLKHKRRYCREPGCSRIVKSQGLCQRHGAKPRKCKVEGCEKQAQGNFDRMCKSHFKAMKRATTPIPKVPQQSLPPPAQGCSVYDSVLPSSISYAPTAGSTMPLIAHLKDGFDNLKPPAWHRNEERRARGMFPIDNPATQLEGWERELVWMEILVLTGAPSASFRHLARAWGRDKGFHMVLAQFICERHGDVQRKKRLAEADKEGQGDAASGKARMPAKKRRRNKKQPGTISADIWDYSCYGDADTNEYLAADIFGFTAQEFENAAAQAVNRWKEDDPDTSSTGSAKDASKLVPQPPGKLPPTLAAGATGIAPPGPSAERNPLGLLEDAVATRAPLPDSDPPHSQPPVQKLHAAGSSQEPGQDLGSQRVTLEPQLSPPTQQASAQPSNGAVGQATASSELPMKPPAIPTVQPVGHPEQHVEASAVLEGDRHPYQSDVTMLDNRRPTGVASQASAPQFQAVPAPAPSLQLGSHLPSSPQPIDLTRTASMTYPAQGVQCLPVDELYAQDSGLPGHSTGNIVQQQNQQITHAPSTLAPDANEPMPYHQSATLAPRPNAPGMLQHPEQNVETSAVLEEDRRSYQQALTQQQVARAPGNADMPFNQPPPVQRQTSVHGNPVATSDVHMKPNEAVGEGRGPFDQDALPTNSGVHQQPAASNEPIPFGDAMEPRPSNHAVQVHNHPEQNAETSAVLEEDRRPSFRQVPASIDPTNEGQGLANNEPIPFHQGVTMESAQPLPSTQSIPSRVEPSAGGNAVMETAQTVYRPDTAMMEAHPQRSTAETGRQVQSHPEQDPYTSAVLAEDRHSYNPNLLVGEASHPAASSTVHEHPEQNIETSAVLEEDRHT